MYVNSRPASTNRHKPGWNVPKDQASSSSRQPLIGSKSDYQTRAPRNRPPLLSSGSSPPSLRGFEQAIPSFRAFVKQNPYVGSEKPLPPSPPLKSRRSQDALLDSYFRRSSSVYSRTPSEWRRDSERSWGTEDLADQPLMLLQPVEYSASTPVERPLVEPRTLSPLIAGLPSTLSSAMTVSLSNSRPQTLLTSQVAPPYVPKSECKPPTISLEEAKRAMAAPGAVPMLPEELRAVALKKEKRRSDGRVRLASTDILRAGQQVSALSGQLVAQIGFPNIRNNSTTPLASNLSHKRNSSAKSLDSRSYSPTQSAFPGGRATVKVTVTPVDTAHDSAYEEEHRKRPWMAKRDNAEGFAREYTSLLTQQSRDHSASSTHSCDRSFDTHKKIVPQPLFHENSILTRRTAATHREGSGSVSPSNLHLGTQSTGSSRSTSSAQEKNGIKRRLSADPEDVANPRISSRSGMIHISPPPEHEAKKSRPRPINVRLSQLGRPSRHRSREGIRESEFYPHIMRRRKNSKKQLPQAGPAVCALGLQQTSGNSRPTADIIAQQLKNAESLPETSHLVAEIVPKQGMRQDSTGEAPEKPKKKLLQKLVAGFKNHRRSSHRAKLPGPETGLEISQSTPESPHPFPSPSQPARPRLRWSDRTKHSFDDTPALDGSPEPQEVVPSHESMPVPVQEQPGSALTLMRPGMIGELLHFHWREYGATKRRKELKKMIRVVSEKPAGPGLVVESTGEQWQQQRPGLVSKTSSTSGWV